jgi:putative transposase
MRMARIKPKGRDVVYHCVSRIVGGEFLLENLEKEKFRKMMWAQAEFCGVDVVSYCLMSNHVHLLIRVPSEICPSDREIMGRYSKFYGAKHPVTKRLVALFDSGEGLSDDIRDRLLSRMGDISVFNKELKQRFSAWYNRQQGRFGTLWAERFRSTIVEGCAETLMLVSAYIDLNPVRAGMVKDPKDYRYCGYAEALAGGKRIQNGIMSFLPSGSWSTVSSRYREYLFVKGGHSASTDRMTLDRELILEEIKNGAILKPVQLLRLRIRYISDGVVLGSTNYVNELYSEFRNRFGKTRETGARPMALGLRPFNLKSLRDLRRKPFG